MKLAPFTPYMSKPTNESRLAITHQIMTVSDETTDQIVQGLIQVIAMEGPVLSTRAFTLYAKKGGLAKLSGKAAKRFSAALKKGIVEGKISMELDTDAVDTQALLWLPTMERVNPRESGNRGFDDIPASELGEVMFELAAEVGDDKDTVFQAIADLYGLKQLPKNATTRLDYVFRDYLS
ncbi:MAG: hypothetical protein OQK24_02980 [Magnetovibrio sp.]|nr:hypothetical protein [Magnetovibrio sp.]